MSSPAFVLPWLLPVLFLLRFLLAGYVKSPAKRHPIYSLLPLRHNLRETRLIRLQPGKWDDLICCHLDVVSLEERPEFEALSYTWGERQRNNAKSRMRLNGQDFPIALNLETALRHLRSEADARTLWVDAICINQADIEERNEQISIIRDVYSYSKRVLIWLGTVDEPRRPKDPNVKKQQQICHWRTDFTTWSESSAAHPEDVAIIDDFHDRIDQYYRLPLSLRHNLTIDHVKGAFCFASLLAQNKHVNGHDIPILNNHDAFHRIILALFGIMDRPWWIRQWVIQEIVLAPSAILHHGHFVAPWELFSHAARNYEHHRKDCCQNHYKYLHGNDIRHVEHFYRTIIELDDLRHKWQSILKNQAPIKINLRELLWQFRSRDTTDPKDKVFALFPLVNDWGNQDQMEADYNMEIRRIYRDVVEKVMVIDESLLILMGSTEKSKDLVDLPSWVPDWTTKPPQFESERLERTKLFNVSKGIKSKPKFHGQKVLELGGVRFDSITTTSGIMVYGDDDETLEVFRSWYSLLCDNQPIMSRYPTKEPQIAAYWRTLYIDTIYLLSSY
ncbi:heterokaryon incompatibility [Fusarium albosuccineum]|uniref:Heterokaryon incompatibility n=1 Tax=Fusarium albosuccineum TaxID=1237068 RepID=A0A8H4KZZ7_9HYPO|nr:heterokaryon incompatibility [Fusarium albosuccineum]